MSYRLVESYDDENIVVLYGRSFPATCLVEDDGGMRILVSASWEIRATTWVRASTAGASAVLRHDAFSYLSVEEFMEAKVEHKEHQTFQVPDGWHPCDGPISYSEMKTTRAAAKASFTPFVHLHAHSEFSALDGLSRVDEMVKAAVDDNQPALAVTDHGVCAAHPYLQSEAKKAGIKPIFGVEAYLVEDRFARGPDAKLFLPADGATKEEIDALKSAREQAAKEARDYYHLILWAMNDEGLQNLWAMSTTANKDGLYYHPRLDWSVLETLHEGVMCSTACLRGPLAYPLLQERPEQADANLGRLLNIFGDRLYIELGTCELVEQQKVNRHLIEMADTFSVPTIAVVDSHYPCHADRQTHRVWIAAQTNKDLQDEADLFAGDTDYHVMAANEVRQYLSYLPEQVVDEAMGNTIVVADRCDASIKGKSTTPVFSKKGSEAKRIQDDIDRLVDMCLANWDKKVKGKRFSEDVYIERFDFEMKLLISKKFCGYFLMVAEYCRWCKGHTPRILVGPGRGSGGGSLVAYLADITEIDPVDAELLFARFLTEGRTSLPDFDVDFPASKREDLTAHVVDLYGADAVVRVGTHIRFKNKGVIRALARVLKNEMDIHYPDIDAISAIIEEAESGEAGLGLKWEDLWEQHGDVLEPYKIKYPSLFEYAEKMVGRLAYYGKHAAGVVISADGPLTTRLPMRVAGDQLVADWDMDALEAFGLVKFDLLTLRTLDTIQMCLDLIQERDGEVIDIYGWTAQEYDDPQIWDEISNGNTLGIFQIETRAGTRLTKQFRPRSVADLADVITLVRPGPVRSGLTATYFRRKDGQEEVTYPDPRMELVLAKTYGCLLYQEDIMQACMVLGGYGDDEADRVRKILGKKKVEAVMEEGKQFIARTTENGMEQGAATTLWEQMAEFAKYSFNRAHAFGYAVIGHWTAWLKFHYPQLFLVAALSTVDQDRIPEFITEARRMGYKVLPPDVNESGVGFKPGEVAVRYGLDGVKGLGDKAVEAVTQGQPYKSWDDFLARKGKAADTGKVKIMARVGCFDSLVSNRRQLERQLEWETSGEADRCQHKDETVVAEHGLPCGFDWSSEPVQMGRKGQPLKAKPPPKRCTKACRNYTAPDFNEALSAYTDEDIRNIEKELLGVHLSSTPFDIIPEDILEECRSADEVDIGPPDIYFVAATVSKVRPHRDRHGKEMGFISLYAQTGDIDVTVFKGEWVKYHNDLALNQLVLAYIKKDDRGMHLKAMEPI